MEFALRSNSDKLGFLREVHYALLVALQSENASLRAYAESVQDLLADAVDRVKEEIFTATDVEGLSPLKRELAFFKRRYPFPVDGSLTEEEGAKLRKEETDESVRIRLCARLDAYSSLIRSAHPSGNRASADLVFQPELRLAFAKVWTMLESLPDGIDIPDSWKPLREAGYIASLPNRIFFVTQKGQQVYLPEMDE